MKIDFCFEEIDECKKIGDYKDEYVYDVEVDNEQHTFMANDILVHNSLFISFYPAICHCKWQNLTFNIDYLNSIDKKFIILVREHNENDIPKFTNDNYVATLKNIRDVEKCVKDNDVKMILIDGDFIIHDDKDFMDTIDDKKSILHQVEIRWNWANERSFCLGLDYYRYCDFFKQALNIYAKKYNVENKEDFELEKVIKSLISIAKKRYIGDVVYEDGLTYDSLEYIYLKGVELVRSSTPLFARERIMDIVKYLLTHPDTYNIQDLLKQIKQLRKEFEIADIDEIAMQSSMSNYESKVIDDKNSPMKFVNGVHFSVKAAAYYNHLLSNHKELQKTYDFLKSGEKIKYYYTKNKIPIKMVKSNGGEEMKECEVFAYTQGAYPIEFAPEIDYDTQFAKSILSPINSIATVLGMPKITDKLRVVMDIFSGFDI